MGDYFRHARAIDRSLRWALRAAPLPIGTNLVRAADGVRFVDAREAAERPETWLALFQAAIDDGCAVSDEALACVQQNAGRFVAGRLLSDPQPSRGAAALPEAAARPLRRGSPRCTTRDCSARCFPEFKAINCRVVRDFYHKYTVDEHTLLTIRNLERLTEPDAGPNASASPACWASSRRRSCSSCRCSITTSASGRDDDHAAESARMAHADARSPRPRRRGARPTSSSSSREHLKMSLVAFRRDTEDPGDRPAVRRARRRRRTAEDALPHDARRRRGRQPGDADAVEGGAALAALRRHLQPPDADVRRRGHRPRAGGASPTLIEQRPADFSADEIAGVPRRAAAPVPAALLTRRGVSPRPAVARDLGPDARPGLARAHRRGLGADRR